jgi:hypothetical protein
MTKIERAQIISCIPSTRGIQVVADDYEDQDSDEIDEESEECFAKGSSWQPETPSTNSVRTPSSWLPRNEGIHQRIQTIHEIHTNKKTVLRPSLTALKGWRPPPLALFHESVGGLRCVCVSTPQVRAFLDFREGTLTLAP